MSSELERLIKENEAIDKRRKQADKLAAEIVSTPGISREEFLTLFSLE